MYENTRTTIELRAYNNVVAKATDNRYEEAGFILEMAGIKYANQLYALTQDEINEIAQMYKMKEKSLQAISECRNFNAQTLLIPLGDKTGVAIKINIPFTEKMRRLFKKWRDSRNSIEVKNGNRK